MLLQKTLFSNAVNSVPKSVKNSVTSQSFYRSTDILRNVLSSTNKFHCPLFIIVIQ